MGVDAGLMESKRSPNRVRVVFRLHTPRSKLPYMITTIKTQNITGKCPNASRQSSGELCSGMSLVNLIRLRKLMSPQVMFVEEDKEFKSRGKLVPERKMGE